MEVLEEEVRKLQEQKAAVESANDELQRQNKYWEDLFSKQQLQFAGQISVAPLASSTNGSSVEFNSQTELTITEHSQSGASLSGASLSGASLSALSGAESSHELSYTSLKMASDKGAKR